MINKFLAALVLTCSALTFLLIGLGHSLPPGPFAVLALATIAILVTRTERFRTLAFTFWVLASVTACMFYPDAFIRWGDFELKVLIVPLIQLIMFGMGTTLSAEDFLRVFKMPRAILIGMILQFSVMPLLGLLIARSFGFDPLIAAGIILVGSCPGGVASNVVTYIARGNVALSVTMTACSTLVSPLMTPLAMKILAQQYTQIDFTAMMISITKMILVPVIAGLLVNKLLNKYSQWRDRCLPVFSMFCLCLIIAIITALSRDQLLAVGLALIFAAALLNIFGYLFGYFGARFLGLDVTSCRTIAIEVGLQNGGMASGIAMNVMKSSSVALAPAIFGPWMNLSGSVLASFWRRTPVDADTQRIVTVPRSSSSRSNIYYWKCDSPVPEAEKRVYNDKYRLADICELVTRIAADHYGDDVLSVVSAGGEGNHYTYLIRLHDKELFFRADDGKTGDDYMDAETAAMNLVRQHGVCVPEIYHCDTSKSRYPVRFQIMERVPGEPLNSFYKNQTLNRRDVAQQTGRLLARMHGITCDGFGFFDTNVLSSENRIVGLDRTNRDYFNKRLGDHCRFLRDRHFLETQQIREIEQLIEKHASLLDIERGSVVHKDLAFWNMIGTADKINGVIDWDDVIVGDPADDIAVMRCFYGNDVLEPLCSAYQESREITDEFRARVSLYLVRNMLWKAVIRTIMGYFEMNDFFLLSDENRQSLKQVTYERLFMGVEELKKL